MQEQRDMQEGGEENNQLIRENKSNLNKLKTKKNDKSKTPMKMKREIEKEKMSYINSSFWYLVGKLINLFKNKI